MTSPSYPASPPIVCTIFETALGWWGVGVRLGKVSRLVIGHTAPEEVRQSLSDSLATVHQELDFVDRPAKTETATLELFRKYAEGQPVDFSEVEVDLPPLTPFLAEVYQAARRIPYGEIRTYGELAAAAGKPKAARAVGNAMARNRTPILIPCHRVIGSDGSLRGFSTPQGLILKQRMLDMEAAQATLF